MICSTSGRGESGVPVRLCGKIWPLTILRKQHMKVLIGTIAVDRFLLLYGPTAVAQIQETNYPWRYSPYYFLSPYHHHYGYQLLGQSMCQALNRAWWSFFLPLTMQQVLSSYTDWSYWPVECGRVHSAGHEVNPSLCPKSIFLQLDLMAWLLISIINLTSSRLNKYLDTSVMTSLDLVLWGGKSHSKCQQHHSPD